MSSVGGSVSIISCRTCGLFIFRRLFEVLSVFAAAAFLRFFAACAARLSSVGLGNANPRGAFGRVLVPLLGLGGSVLSSSPGGVELSPVVSELGLSSSTWWSDS